MVLAKVNFHTCASGDTARVIFSGTTNIISSKIKTNIIKFSIFMGPKWYTV